MSGSTREQQLFDEARDLKDPRARQVYLDQACAGDNELRRNVEALLGADVGADSYFAEGSMALEQSMVSLAEAERSGDHIGPDDTIAAGRYKLLEKVGEGGCGVVYVAEQTEPVRRRVALKIIKLGMDTKQVVARFEAERQALAMMDHPNIAKVLDAGTTEQGRPYFVMELVRGIKITEYCDQNQLNTHQRIDLFVKVCQAVQHAHQKGIIHRDLKPSNILVTLHDPAGPGCPKVIDFGIAKATEGRLTEATVYTQLHHFIGTPAYMSPEQADMSPAAAGDIDTRSDIYSLGVLLYELLTGRTPFEGKDLMSMGLDAMRKTIREKEPPRPSTRLSQTLGAADGKRRQSTSSDKPTTEEEVRAASRRLLGAKATITALKGDLDWIVMKCLEKDRTRRYETANGLAADLDRHLNNEPVVARPPSTAYRFQKAWRRNKIVFTASAAVAVALIVGISISLWQAALATAARNDAQAAQAKAEGERNRAETQKLENRLRAYAAEINAAFHALDENNLGRAIELRDHWLPKAGEDDLRGFEWRLLWQLSQYDANDSIPGGTEVIRFSPDGKWLAYNFEATIVVRAWPSRRVVKKIPSRNLFLGFSPDSKLLAAGGREGLKLWSVDDWQETKTLKVPKGVGYTVLFSPQGKWLVTGARPKGYRVWNTETWESGPAFGDGLLREWVAKSAVAFSPDGTLLLTPGHREGRESGNQFQVWEFPSLKPRSNFEPFPGRLSCAAFAPDGKQLLTGTFEGMVLVWDVASGRIVRKIKAHTACVNAVAITADGSRFATSGFDQTVVLWDAATYERLVRLRGHLGDVEVLAISPEGATLVSGSADGTIKFWDATTRHTQPELPGQEYAIGFSADSRRLLAAGYTKASLWNLNDGTTTDIPIRNYERLLEQRSWSGIVSASRDVYGTEPLAVFGLTEGGVEIWDTAAMNRVSSWRAGDGDVRAVAFLPNGQSVATGNDKGDVVLWETGTHRELRRFEPMRAALRCLTFSPDGRLLAGSSDDSVLSLWEVDTGKLIQKRKLDGPAYSVTFSPDGGLLLTGQNVQSSNIWEVPSLTVWGSLRERMFGTFSPDGRTIASVSETCRLKLWHVATQQEMVTIDIAGGGRSVKFSPDGRTLAVGYLLEPKEFIRLWTAPTLDEIDAKRMSSQGRE